jgi:hypothetical protein
MQLRARTRPTSPATTTGLRRGLRWLVTFVGFPLGGLLAELVGPVDGPTAAIAGGALTGLTIGAVQAWALRPDGISPVPWIGATTAGLAVGLGVGAAAVDYGTTAGDLAVQGAVCGLAVGLAQAVVLRARLGDVAFLWAPALAGVWALGWTITSAIGVDVERQYTVFGSSGAIVVTLVTMVLPFALARANTRSAS